MADRNYLRGEEEAAPENDALGTAGDFAKGFGAAAAEVGAGLAGDARYFAEKQGRGDIAGLAQAVGDIFHAAGDTFSESINPKTQQLAAAALTSPEFLEHPALGLALKANNMIPGVLSIALPSALWAKTLRGATMLAAGGGAAMNAGEGVSEFYKELDGLSDEKLQEQSPKYRAMREMMSEEQARSKFNDMAQGWSPFINAALGAVTGVVGPAGTAARYIKGGAGKAVVGAEGSGRLASGAIAGLEGAGTNAVQEGVSDLTVQNAEHEADLRREFDYAQAANKALEGGVLGGIIGGATGAVAGGKAKPKKLPDQVASTDTPDAQVQNGTTGVAAKPVDFEANPQNAPATTPRDKGKGDTKTTAPAKPVDQTQPVDPAIAAAVAANDPAPTAQPTEAAAAAAEPQPMAQRSPNETLDKLDQEGKPPVPPEVTATPAEPAVSGNPTVVAPESQGTTLDTGQNVPEAPQSIQEQIKQIGTGGRKAVMLPVGTVVPKGITGNKTGLKKIPTGRGVFVYDPKLVSVAEINRLSKVGRENELLGLGPVAKPEAVARVAAGETPPAVTERTPAGTEVKAAAGTTETVPAQVASLETQKTPGNVVAVETPEAVVEKRNAQGGRIIETNTENITNHPKFADNEARAAAADEERLARIRKAEAEEAGAPSGPGTNYRGQRGRDRDAAIATAKEAVEAHPPNEDKEKGAQSLPVPRAALIERARAMVAYAEKKLGKPIQSQIKLSKDGKSTSDSPDVLTLRIAKDLVKQADRKSPSINKIVADFKADEFMIRNGYKDEVIKRRLEEGNREKQQHGGEEAVGKIKAEEDPKGLDEEDFPLPDEKTDDEAPSLATGEVTSVDADVAVNPTGDLSEHEAGEITQGPSVKHIKDVVNEKAKSNLSPREARKAAMAGKVVATKGAPIRLPTKNEVKAAADKYAAAKGIRAEALRVDANPAQAKADNYKKGHKTVEGLPFTVENPAGSVRRGFDDAGNVIWKSKMPAGVDYGYFKGTRGADGDHIDGFDLRTGQRNFIVDQLDTRTGEFDEHKVFVRAKDEAHVVDTYRAAFSDGRADDRLGNLHEVTREELHEWLGKTQTEPVTKTMLDRNPNNVNFDAPEGPTKAHVTADGIELNPIKSTTGEAMLNEMDLSQVPGIHGVVSRFTQSMLKKLAKNVEVHLVSEADMKKLSGLDALGLHVYYTNTNAPSTVYISTSAKPTGYGVGTRNHALLHELVHAVTSREIENVPGAASQITKLMQRVIEHAGETGELENILLKKGNLHYGLTNVHEFMAEALSNQKFQEFLATVPIDRRLANELGIHPRGRAPNAWDMVRHWVKKAIERVTGVMPNFDSALDGILRVGDVLTSKHVQQHLRAQEQARTAHEMVRKDALKMVDDAADFVKNFVARPENNTAERSAKLLSWRTLENIGQLGNSYFQNHVIQRISNAVEKRRVRAERIAEMAEPNIIEHARLRALNPEKYADLTTLRYGATMANLHADVPLTDAKNAHLAGNKVVGGYVWQKAQHAELHKLYNSLPEEFKALYHADGKYFREQQQMMASGIQNNQILKLFGVKDAAMAERIRTDTVTDADRALLGRNLEVIQDAAKLSKIEGYYVPLMRHGDHVVQAETKVTLPGNAKAVNDGAGNVIPNELEFATDKEAMDYAKASPLEATIDKVWLDPATGERLGADELDAVARYRVAVQNKHVEFVDGKRAAEARRAELAKDGSLTVHEVVPRKFEPNVRQGAEIATALGRLVKKLERSDAYEAASPTDRAAMRRAIEEAALASHGSTRISSKALPRRNVAGASENAIKDMHTYAQSSSRYIAGLEHNAELEAAVKEMNEQLTSDHSKGGLYARTQIANEVTKRLEGDNGYQQGGALAPWIKRAMSASFTDKLGSPAYSIINAMQPAMISMPYFAAKYGAGRAFMHMGKAYADIQSKSIIGQGAAATVRQFAKRGGSGDLVGLVKANLSADEKAMIDAHLEIGTIDKSAGLEVGDLVKDYTGAGGKVDAALGYLEGITREMPKAVETVNRSVTALAGYRMARAAGETHAQAIQSSIEAVNNTQFNYSPTNAPPVFNHPLFKVALQFKKYGQGMYQLIGTQIGRAMRNEKPGDRAEAVKTLIYVAGTHMAMAGALGLPTEPFKYLLMGASAAGLPVGTWSDVEDKIRKAAAGTLGVTGGEVFSRGLPRLLGLDLSRIGLDSVTSFGEPRGKKESDVKSWLFDSVSGPVVSLGGDYIKGLQSVANGDFGKAAEQMIPLKAASDSLRAYRQATEGKKTAGGTDKSAPYTPKEAALRALGFGNAREAEEGAKTSQFYRASSQAKEQRSALVSKWVSASPTEKTKAWADITKWNQQASPEQKISPKELTDKAKRDAKNAKDMVLGIKPNKRDKRFLDEGLYYNTR